MAYPDFICVGFQKCGTTTLYELLGQHPQIALTREVKEPMWYRVPYFSYYAPHSLYEWRYFGDIPGIETKLKGEINAGLTFTNCAQRLKRDTDSSVKMMFVMRNPAERCYSAYKYFVARGFLPGGEVEKDAQLGHAQAFDQYVHSVLDNPRKRKHLMDKRLKYLVFSQSNYATCIEEYQEIFPDNPMKYFTLEEFSKNPHAICREIYDFLGVDDCEGINYNVRANEGRKRAVSSRRAKWTKFVKGWHYGLYELACMSHWAPNAYPHFKNFYDNVRAKAIVEDTREPEPMLCETRAYLMDYYEDEVTRTEQLTKLPVMELWGYDTPITYLKAVGHNLHTPVSRQS